MGKDWWRQGRWMWHPSESAEAFDHVIFRKVIALDHIPTSARIGVTASCVYRLYLNGRFQMQGPARSLAGNACVDILSLTNGLQIGTNVVAIEVVFAQHWQAGFYGVAPGAFAAVQINGEVLDILSGWTCFRPEAYDVNAPRCGNSRPPVEIFNANKIDPAWKTAALVPVKWATPIDLGGDGSPPWQRMTERDVPYPELTWYEPASVLALERGSGDSGPGHPDTLKPHRYDDELLRIQTERRLPAKTAAVFDNIKRTILLPGHDHDITVDFGQIVSGYIGFVTTGHAGDAIDIGWNESLSSADGTVRPRELLNLRQVARYTLRHGEQQFQMFTEQTFRYLRIVNRSCNPVNISCLRVVSCHVARPTQSAFKCSDPNLNRVFDAARETAVINTADMTMDCPERERNSWFHDGFWTTWAYLMLSGDVSVNRRMCRMAADILEADPNATFAPCFVPPPPAGMSLTIPGHSLFWVLQAGLDLAFSRSDAFGSSVSAAVSQQMHGLENFESTEGLLTNLPGWNWLDWTARQNGHVDVEPDSVCVSHNALYAKALDVAARITGNSTFIDRAARIRSTLDSLCPGILFPDRLNRVRGRLRPSSHRSETTQNFCLWTGVATGARRDALWAYVRDGFDMTEHEQKMSQTHRRRKGLFRAGAYGYPPRLAVAGEMRDTSVMHRNLVRTYGYMVDKGPGTLWEQIGPSEGGYSLCQGVSSAPAPLLLTYILGVQISDDGRIITIAPGCGDDLKWCRGYLTTSHGRIAVAWTRSVDSFRITASTPDLYTAILRLPSEARAIWSQVPSAVEWQPCIEIKARATVAVTPGHISIELPDMNTAGDA